MALSYDLISLFAKQVTKNDKKTSSESTVYGTVVVDGNGDKYVKLDGSDQLTPLTDTSAKVNKDERVSVLIKNHTATVTGNISSPAARTGDVEDLGIQVSEIQKFDIVVTEQLQANDAYIKELQADKASIGDLKAANAKIAELEANKASIVELNAAKAEITDLIAGKIDADVVNATFATIESLNATNAKVLSIEGAQADFENLTTQKLTAIEGDIGDLDAKKISAEQADLTFATIENLNATNAKLFSLEGTYADFENLTTQKLIAIEGDITELEAKKLTAEQANLMYANIDFSNIGKAAMEKFYADSGLIRDVVIGDGTITGHLVGVTVSGDLLEGNTVKADKLVIKGSDGLYYKLNFEGGKFAEGEAVPNDSLHGSVITAKSITAEKVRVDDLVAFDATIGGFHITKDAIHSGVKESVDNIAQGLYMDKTGQMALGDDRNFIKYFLDEETGDFKLEISADSILLSSRSKSIEELLEVVDNLEVGSRNLLSGTGNGYGWLYHTIDLANHAFSIQNGETSVLSDGLRTYSAYPRVVDGVFEFDGMSSRLDGTTFVLSGEPKTMSIYNVETPISLDAGQTYTLSFYAKRDNDARSVDVHIVDVDSGHAEPIILEKNGILSDYGEFSRFAYTFTSTGNHDRSVLVKFDLQGGTGPTTTLTVKDIKLEQGTITTDWTVAPEDVDRDLADLRNTTDDIRSEMVDQRTEIINTCTEIIMSAVESRVAIDDYGEFKSSVESQLRVMADSIDMNFKTTESRVDGVDDKFVELYKYISFSQEGITIGSGDSTITLTLDNDGIVFSKSGKPFGKWDGTDFYTGNIIIEVNERAQFGDFAFTPDEYGLSFYKVR